MGRTVTIVITRLLLCESSLDGMQTDRACLSSNETCTKQAEDHGVQTSAL